MPRVSYTHHPPGFALALSLFFRVGGDSEGTARIFTILLTSLAAPIAVLLLSGPGGRPGPAGLIAGLLWAVLPGPAFFGRTPTFFSLGLPIVALLVLATRGSDPRPRLSAVLSFLLPWTYLPNLLILPPLFLSVPHHRPRAGLAKTILLPAAIGTLLLFLQIFLLQGPEGLTHLARAGSVRADAAQGLPPLKFFALIGLLLPWIYLTMPVLLLAVAGAVQRGTSSAAPLLLFGALHLVLFPQAARIHDYWSLGFWYGLVLFAGRGAEYLLADGRFLQIRRGLVAATILLGVAEGFAARPALEAPRPYDESIDAARRAGPLPPNALLDADGLSPHHILYYSGRALAPESLDDFAPMTESYRRAVAERPVFRYDAEGGRWIGRDPS